MKYLKCISLSYSFNDRDLEIFHNLTLDKIYIECDDDHLSDHYWIKNDTNNIVYYPKECFEDITREMKLKKILK